MRKFLVLLIPFFIVSCATTMPGDETSTSNKNLKVAIAINDTFTNDRVQMHQFSLQNHSDEWMEFDGATLVANNNVKVLVGDRISSWIEACTLEKSVSDYNTSLLLGSLAIGGAVVAGASQHPSTSTTGAVVALGSISAMAVRDYQSSKKKTEFQEAFPEKHIFRPFVIPPGKVIQRWILLEDQSHEAFTISMKNKSGEEVIFKVKSPKSQQIR